MRTIVFFTITFLLMSPSLRASPSQLKFFSFDVFAHYSFRSNRYTAAGGADWKPIIPFFIGNLRPFVGAFAAKSSKVYPVAEAGFHMEFNLSQFSLFIGPNLGASFERKVNSDALLFGPSAGVSYAFGKDYSLFANLVIYPSESNTTNQIRAGLAFY